MKIFKLNWILKIPLSIIFIMHSIPTMVSGTIRDFGEYYLNSIGLAPFGIVMAWFIKLSHLVFIVSIWLNRYVWLTSIVTIFILIMGIVMVHFPDGWFVVGGGRNGVEFNFLLVFVILFLMFENKK